MYVVVSLFLLLLGVGMVGVSISSSQLQTVVHSAQPSTMVKKVQKGDVVPGHPLYLFVVSSERVELLFVQNKIQKAWLLRERSNSRFETALSLYSYNENRLGTATLNKSLIYMDKAIEMSIKLPDEKVQQELLSQIQKDLQYYSRELHAKGRSMTDSDRSQVDHFLNHVKAMDNGLSGRIK